ncbi:hypothetical protein AB0I22_27670 [Streptomyces sp. NPDC050610]|uniref:hypothetical protein n=1 Tax=Streptomyces sp. NPDC050610 TaxID=3157097 RepID=UPI00343E0F80
MSFTNETLGVEERHPVKRSESRRSAADVFQDFLGIPRLGAGRTCVTLELLIPWIYARQRNLPNDYLDGQGKEQRIAVGRVLLGADDETVDALRQEAGSKAKEWRSANNRVKKILRDREERELPSVEDLQRRAAQWTAQHREASDTAGQAGTALSRLHTELTALQQKVAVAEGTRRSARAAADDRERTARLLEGAAAEAQGTTVRCADASTKSVSSVSSSSRSGCPGRSRLPSGPVTPPVVRRRPLMTPAAGPGTPIGPWWRLRPPRRPSPRT